MKRFRLPDGTVVTGRVVGRGQRAKVQYTVSGNRGRACKRFFPLSLAEEVKDTSPA